MRVHFKFEHLRFLVLAVAIIAAADLAILRWYFPLTEGWWETYAWLTETGGRLYSDIWISHPPLHVFMMRAEMALVGHDFLLLRLLGVATHGLTVCLLYLWLTRLTTPPAAFFGAVLSTLLMIGFNGTYIVRDYHATVEFFEVVALCCSASALMARQNDSPRDIRGNMGNVAAIFGAGIACGALLLVKQNVGVFFTATLGVAIVLRALDRRNSEALQRTLIAGVVFILGCASLPLVTTLLTGGEWLSVYFNNRAKGSPLLVLTRFVVDSDSRKVLVGSIAAVVLFSGNPWIEARLSPIAKYFSRAGQVGAAISHVLSRTVAFIAVACLFRLGVAYTVFSLSLGWVAYRAFHSRSDNKGAALTWYEYGWLPLVGLAYCGTNTAGYNTTSMQLILAPMIADLTHRYCDDFSSVRSGRLLVVAGLGAALLTVGMKMAGPMYDWWGLRQGSVQAAQYPLPFDELQGFRVDRQTTAVFEALAAYKNRLGQNDAVFAYPAIPVAYLLLNKKPPTALPTLWFDVSDISQLDRVVGDLERTKPAVIFWLKPPDSVYEAHEKLRQLPSLIGGVDRWLYGAIASGQYRLESLLPLNADQSWELQGPNGKSTVTTDFLVASSGLNCGKISRLQGVVSTSACSGEGQIAPGAVISVTFLNRHWHDENAAAIGIPHAGGLAHTFIVLRRNDNSGGAHHAS